MSDAIIKKAGEIIANNTVTDGTYTGQSCVLSLIDSEGYPAATVLTASQSDGIKRIWFCTGLDSEKVKKIRKNNKASVCFSAAEYGITLVGEIEIITDEVFKKDMWYPSLEGHFPKGATDPQYCVLQFTTKRYSLFVDCQEIKGGV